MHALAKITFLVCVAILLGGCHSVTENGKLVQADLARVESPTVSEEQQMFLSDGNNSFAFDLFHRINLENTDNLIYSPYSIWMAFSMVYAGAQGETQSQMADVFHFLDQDNQHITLNAIDQRLQALGTIKQGEDEGSPFQLKLANAVWSQQGYAFKQPFLDLLATQYGAGLRVVDFQASTEAAREAINAWVNEQTNERIKEIATPGSISPDTRFVLTNAIYFKAGWMYKFDQAATADGSFTLMDGSHVTVPLMHLGAPLDYLDSEDYQAVRLPYVGYKTEMWIILPAEGRFEAVKGELGPVLMNKIEHQAGMDHVTLTMPSFTIESDLALNNLLVQMGLTQAFCPEGDFGGISDGGGLCIGQAIHKATIKVDEEGTEATAATMVAMPVSIMKEVEMKVDRPFIFAIVDRDNGLILFLGQVLDPAVQVQ